MPVNLKWRVPGLYKADANLVAAEIEEIGESATAEQILEKARDRKTELHKCFCWDDTEAAEKWRLHTARLVSGSIIIDRVNAEPDEPQIRYFHRAEGSAYKPMPVIIKRLSEYEAMLQRAYAELAAFKKKYSGLSEDLDELLTLFP